MQPQVYERCNEHNNTFQETTQSCFKHCAKNIPTWITSVCLITSFSFSVTWKLFGICMFSYVGEKRGVRVCLWETNQIQLASCEWCLDSGCAALPQANSTAASFSSTSYETRGYAAHWKVHKATLKTKPFTNSHFRCGFLFASLFFFNLQRWWVSATVWTHIIFNKGREREREKKERRKKERVSG